MEYASSAAAAATGSGPGGKAWVSHPVDLRFTFRLPFGRYYLALVAGPERRPAKRTASERRDRRFATLGNFLFFCATAVIVNALALAALLIYSAVLRF